MRSEDLRLTLEDIYGLDMIQRPSATLVHGVVSMEDEEVLCEGDALEIVSVAVEKWVMDPYDPTIVLYLRPERSYSPDVESKRRVGFEDVCTKSILTEEQYKGTYLLSLSMCIEMLGVGVNTLGFPCTLPARVLYTEYRPTGIVHCITYTDEALFFDCVMIHTTSCSCKYGIARNQQPYLN